VDEDGVEVAGQRRDGERTLPVKAAGTNDQDTGIGVDRLRRMSRR
jgi:hypothetical protein